MCDGEEMCDGIMQTNGGEGDWMEATDHQIDHNNGGYDLQLREPSLNIKQIEYFCVTVTYVPINYPNEKMSEIIFSRQF